MSAPSHPDVATHGSPIPPGVDADVKKRDPVNVEILQDLRVDDYTLYKGMEYEHLSLYEKKSVLINRELDAMNQGATFGLGRYQKCIFVLCGFGYFLDLCWAQAFGLVIGPLQAELGVAENHVGDLSAAFSAGLCVGAFSWGLLCDIIGRKWCFNLTCLIASVFGLIFAGPSNYNGLCFITACIGVGVGGNIPIDATITLEFLPNNRRFLLAWLSTFQPLGVVVSSLIAWGLVPKYSCDTALPACNSGQTPCCEKKDNMGWRYLMITLGCITLFVFLIRFAVFNFQESPKFLLSKGHDEEAIAVVHHIAKFNKAPVPSLTIEHFQALDQADERSIESTDPLNGGQVKLSTKEHAKTVGKGALGQFKHLKGLFATKRMIWLTISIWLSYITLFFSFSIAGGFLPLILRAKGVDTNLPISTTYRNYVIVYLPGIVATILAGLLMEVPWLGRRYSMAIAAALMGTSLFLFATVDNVAGFVGLNAMEYFMQSLYAALLYGSTPEYFPAPYRGSASGFAATLGRIAGIVAPLIAQTIFSAQSNSVLYLAGGAALVSMLCVLTIPIETRGKQTF